MRTYYYPIFRIVSILIIGVLLVVLRGEAAGIIVSCIGLLFLLSGAFTLIAFYAGRAKKRREEVSYFPVVSGLGCLLFGLWLFITPSFFVGIMMVLLGISLALLGLYQIISLWRIRDTGRVTFFYYAIPLLVLILGCLVVLNPFEAASLPFLLLGIGAIVYALSDLINLLKFRPKGNNLRK